MANRIQEALIKKNGGNQSEMARYVGVAPQAVQKWIAGKSEPRGKNLERAAEFLGVPAAVLKFGPAQKPQDVGIIFAPNDLEPSLRRIIADEVESGPNLIGRPKLLPVVGRCQAGPGGLLVIDDYPAGLGDGTVEYWAKCENAYSLRIRGESMSPRYLPGEFVAVDPCSEVLPSQEAIVLLRDDRRLIKRLLWINNGQACFESINKDYQNITLELEEIFALHRVLGRVPPEAFKPSI
jgi:phage repressor protein C with HTH and peptisase S24 domain